MNYVPNQKNNKFIILKKIDNYFNINLTINIIISNLIS